MAWWPFGARSFLDRDDEDWQFETWRWLLQQGGGIDGLRGRPLVLPTREFFPPTEATGHARAEYLFALVKQLAGMDEWRCRLVAQPRRPDLRVGAVTAMQAVAGAPAGTFGADGNQVVITYDPAGIDRPMALIATLIHELAHYWLATLPDLPPGGEENVEFATDLATVYLGFGVFGANSAFNFQQHQDVLSQGWSWSRQGYLTEREWALALAVFLRLGEHPREAAMPHLKSSLADDLTAALRYLDRNSRLIAELAEASAASR